MNNGFLLFLGILAAMAASWMGVIFGSQAQLGNLQYSETIGTQQPYPVGRLGLPELGLQVYRANGCYYCHTQQVRPEGLGADIQRGWGLRRSVAPDFLLDQPAMIGFSRIGPDLHNVGTRMPSREWHFLHLYDPKLVVEKSVMPPYAYLFEKRPIRGGGSIDALLFPEGTGPEPGYEIIPTESARALVEYLLSLRIDVPIFESFFQLPEEEAPTAPAEGAQP